MKRSRFAAVASIIALLSACSGGGGGTVSAPTGGGGGGSTPTASGCSLTERQNWAFAVLNEWYLFPETLPASLNPAPYNSVGAYIDALTATARSQNKDRYFTYLTSIAEETAYYNSGSSAGFGVRLTYDTAARRVFVAEAFENAPALAAGIDRGAEIIAIGTSVGDLRTVDSIMATEGSQGVVNALGPSTAGTTRVLRVTDASGTRNLTVSKADYELAPVSSRYGAKILNDGGTQVGYVNLRTFINPADAPLRSAFAQFRAAGINKVIVDFRYNGGGLVSIAELMANLLGGGRSTSDVLSYTTFRASKSSNNETARFAPLPQSVTPMKIAFIGTGGTASASELVINTFIPYLHANVALVGTNTYGKPVGQIAIDKAACDDRLRVIAFALENRDHQGAYFNGLAGTVEASCRAADDVAYPLGDPNEASTKAALDFLAGRSCTPITAGGVQGAQSLGASQGRELLQVLGPSTIQREVPGAF